MVYVILDSSANLVDSFDQESEARRCLDEIVQADPESAGEYALLTYDGNGQPVGEAVSGADLGVIA